MAVGFGLNDLQARARRRLADTELFGSFRERHAVDNRFSQALLGRRQAILLRQPADRRALHLIRIEDHHEHRSGAILRNRAATDKWQRPHHRAQRRSPGWARQNHAVDLGRVGIHCRTDRSAFADRVTQRSRSCVIDAAQLAITPETQAIGAAQQHFGCLVDRHDAAVAVQHKRSMGPAIERRLGRIRGRSLRRERAAQPERPRQMRTERLHQLELPRPPLVIIFEVGKRQRHHTVRTALDDHTGRVMPKPARLDVFVVVLGLLEFPITDHRFRFRRHADRNLVPKRHVGARLDVVIGVGLQIVFVEILGHAQLLERLPLLMGEQCDAAMRIGALKQRHQLLPVIGIGRCFVNVADDIN